MKSTLFVLLFFLSISLFAQAQQARKTDNDLLLQYYQNQQFNEALSYLKTVYAEPVTNTKELANLAYTASMAGKLPNAENYYQRVYDTDTTSLSALYNIAGISLRRGNSAKAAIYYQKYILKDSTNFQAYKQLATISAGRAAIAAQLNYLKKANKLDPTEFDVASDLSDLYVKLDSLPPAEKVVNQALAADPENVYLLQSLLRLNSAQKKWTACVKTGEQLLQLGDAAVSTVTKLGIAYYQLKQYECGIETFLALPETNQDETTCYFTAACYKELKDQKNAILYFGKAVKLSISPSTAIYYSEMADSYETIGQLKKALAAYQKALLYNDSPLTYYFMATLYDIKLKDHHNALKYFKKYVATKPGRNEQAYLDYASQRIAGLGGM
ncbi:tetratricopeptide repeat protein [Mucilaginibacter sp. dw_454]|uniref:tetratricopeptide repeat protein n=1 Tax=Mucilaginibacter sp. dw_454 TaxID=2720079 RepID=UPI001BD2F235|nr:tetratricopeptide repeat protein [Mucilaginibacter sp. dw_454]